MNSLNNTPLAMTNGGAGDSFGANQATSPASDHPWTSPKESVDRITHFLLNPGRDDASTPSLNSRGL